MKSAIVLAILALTTAAPFPSKLASYEDQSKEMYHPYSLEYYGQYYAPDKYYSKNGLSYEKALYGFEELNKAYQYATAALEAIVKSDAPKEVKYYIMQQLKHGFNFFEDYYKMYMTLSSYKTSYVPYVFTQYAYKEIEEAYHYFQKLYQYVQKQEGTGYWKKAVLFIYLSTGKAYNIFKEGVSEDDNLQYKKEIFFDSQKNTKYESKQYPSYWNLQEKSEIKPYNFEFYGLKNSVAYSKNGLSYEKALYGFEELNKAHQYATAAMEAVGRSDAPKEVKGYIMQQLEHGFNFFEGYHKMYMILSSYKTDYIPYVFTQYAYKEIEEAYHYFQKLHQYVQKQEGTGYWKKAVLFIYLTTEKAYNIFKEGVSEDVHFQYTKEIVSDSQKYTKYESKQYPSYWYLQEKSEIKPYNFEFYGLKNSVAYSKNGLSYEKALYGFEELNKAHQYAMAAMEAVGRSDAPKEVKGYIMQQLEHGFNFFQGYHKMYMILSSYKTDYVPYVFTQYAYKEIEEAYHYFQKLHQYVQKQEGTGYWKKAVLFIYLTTEKAYNIFKEGVSEDVHFQYKKEIVSDSQKYTEYESEQYPSYWYLQEKSEIKPYNFEFYGLKSSVAYKNYEVSPYGYKYFGNSQTAPVA